MTQPRLCILTQYYPPEMGAPQARLSELASRLTARGWSIEVLTALPNYPTGRIFGGYRRYRVAVESVEGIRTVRVPLLPSNRGFARRLVCYITFACAAATAGSRYCTRPDLIWVESPPLFIGVAARALSRRFRCRYVFNVSDLWPESAIRMGVIRRDSVATRLAERLERWCYRGAAGISGQTVETIEFIENLGAARPTAVITNGVDPNRFGRERATLDARTLVGEGGPIFIYAGLLGLAQGLDQVLDLGRHLPAEAPGRIVMVGDGPVRGHLQARVEREGISRVSLVAPQPRERVPSLLACADVALITLGYRLPGAVPSKLYEAMAAGLPILLVADGEPAERVRAAEAGLVVSPGDLDGLRAAYLRLATDPDLRCRLGAAGRIAAETIYDREAIADRLDAFLRGILAQHGD